MLPSVVRFFQLPAGDRSLVLQAIPLLTRSVVSLKLFGFKRCYHGSMNAVAAHSRRISAHRLDAAALAVRRASNGLAIGTCLSRSLALRALLHKNGVETEFRIGVDKEEGELKAHAWLEYNGQPIGERVPREYTAFARLGQL